MQFRFKQFTINQNHCAMKVGTDGVLLGGWATPLSSGTDDDAIHILDVGTGTGLIAIMMSQRFSNAVIDAIDIDEETVEEAKSNAVLSPFGARINVYLCPIQKYNPDKTYDLIVCNPPFFKNSLHCPDRKRTNARHSDSLPLIDLMRHALRMMSSNGIISIILPYEMRADADTAAIFAGLFPAEVCPIKTSPRKSPKRVLLSYTRQPIDFEQQPEIIIGDDTYEKLTSEFYLK